jgi:hypothetical protein
VKTEFFDATSPLAERFQTLHQSLNSFAVEAADLQKNMAVNDEASRALFTALSRISAYADQIQITLSLMGEDVRVTEELGVEPSPEFENAELENCFYEWLRTSRKGAVTVN